MRDSAYIGGLENSKQNKTADTCRSISELTNIRTYEFFPRYDHFSFVLRTFAPIFYCFCASLLRMAARANSHATSCIERARQVLIGQMAIAIALLGFNDLGRSVTPTFLFRNRFYLQLSPHCSKLNKKSMWEVKKNSRFLSTGHRILLSYGCKARETMVSKCKLIL